MKKSQRIVLYVYVIAFTIISGCDTSLNKKSNENLQTDQIENLENADKDLLKDFTAICEDGNINVAIEIPAGTLEKWEVDKSDGRLKLEFIDDNPRIIRYLGYPANYGMIPRTLLSKEMGGDGDPLDVIVLGPPIDRGKVVECKLVGVLYLTDRGEQDDKLIALLPENPLYEVNNLNELDRDFNGITEILQLWFTNYKGPGKIESRGYGGKQVAVEILKSAMEEYQIRNTDL